MKSLSFFCYIGFSKKLNKIKKERLEWILPKNTGRNKRQSD